MSTRSRVVWALQWVLGAYFVVTGVIHLAVPQGLPEVMAWMYDLGTPVHVIAGIAEILGGLGLVLPSLTRIMPWLTPLAAGGLMVVMAGAVVWHATRGELTSIVGNLVVGALLGFCGYVRWRLEPIPPRT
ncbi:MAG: DoxX family protein [Actinomycetota bacterium]